MEYLFFSQRNPENKDKPYQVIRACPKTGWKTLGNFKTQKEASDQVVRCYDKQDAQISLARSMSKNLGGR